MKLHQLEAVSELRERLAKIDAAISNLRARSRYRGFEGTIPISVTFGGDYYGFQLPMPSITKEEALERAAELRAKVILELAAFCVTVDDPEPQTGACIQGAIG